MNELKSRQLLFYGISLGMPLSSEEMEEVIQFETDCIANILRAKAPDDAKE